MGQERKVSGYHYGKRAKKPVSLRLDVSDFGVILLYETFNIYHGAAL